MSNKIPSSLRIAVWNHYNGETYNAKCFTGCGETISVHNFDCGHVIAKSMGGTIELNNLRPICGHCNSSMANMNMDDFIAYYGFKQVYTTNNKYVCPDVTSNIHHNNNYTKAICNICKALKCNLCIDTHKKHHEQYIKTPHDMTYRELQYICKKNNIKANFSRSELIDIATKIHNKEKIEDRYYKSSNNTNTFIGVISSGLSQLIKFIKN